MSTDAVALLGFVSLFVLMLLRVPVGMAMGLVGITEFQTDLAAGNALTTGCAYVTTPAVAEIGRAHV